MGCSPCLLRSSSAPPRATTSTILPAFSARRTSTIMMGTLRPFGKGQAAPPMPQEAGADDADDENDGRAQQRRLRQAEMLEGIAIIDRADRLAEIERSRMQRQRG